MINKLFVRQLLLLSFPVALFLGVAPQLAMAQSSDASPALATPGNTPSAYENPDLVMRYQSTITPEDLAAHLYFFASDFFEGRETSSHGQKLAAQYLASQYRKMGVPPRGTVETTNPMDPAAYFQPFDVYGNRITSTNLTVAVNGETVTSSTNSDVEADNKSYLMFGSKPNVTGRVVFGGYGIGDDDLGYNDFKAMEAAGFHVVDSPASIGDTVAAVLEV